MTEQMTIFGLIGEDETPVIPFEHQKKGTKGWVVMPSGIYTTENGFARNMIGVEVRHMILTKDSCVDEDGYRTQYAESIDIRGDGWWADPKKLYAHRPSWTEIVRDIREHYRGRMADYEIVYTRKNADAMHIICDYQGDGIKMTQ